MLFKKGLSIVDTMGKVYTKILGNRLMDIDTSQAGGQEKKGCIEHILALRLIFDYAITEKSGVVCFVCRF